MVITKNKARLSLLQASSECRARWNRRELSFKSTIVIYYHKYRIDLLQEPLSCVYEVLSFFYYFLILM